LGQQANISLHGHRKELPTDIISLWNVVEDRLAEQAAPAKIYIVVPVNS